MNQYNIFTDNGQGLFEERLSSLEASIGQWLDNEKAEGRRLTHAKVLLSDIANQEPLLRHSHLFSLLEGNAIRQCCDDCQGAAGITIIQQPPIGGAKIGVLLQTGSEPSPFQLDSLRLTDEEVMNFTSYVQTVMLFDKYIALLRERGLSLSEHCVRTWIYVRDIDTNYDGVVKARNDIFRQHGLTIDTHFIASTGIGGRAFGRNVVVAIDFLTCPQAVPQDIQYLHALTHLNPTHEYGVAFERGVRITLPNMAPKLFISGTASINNHGEVVNEGDVLRQTERLLENIAALLADGGASLSDVRYFIIYLRDIADANAVDEYMERKHPGVPRIITYAKVCRPAWLVEMECVAEPCGAA